MTFGFILFKHGFNPLIKLTVDIVQSESHIFMYGAF